MSLPILEHYLARLSQAPEASSRLWLDTEGRARGRFFNSTLTSAFQPVRTAQDGVIVGYEGFARSYSNDASGLSLWNLLDHAASDAESIELDRLCRTLHAINFFRQAGAHGPDLYLSVHARLLAAVEGDHGRAFRRVVAAFGVDHQDVVLQLPASSAQQRWVLKFVAENYARNGFRLVVNAADARQALGLIAQVKPEAIKLDGREIIDEEATLTLLEAAAAQGVGVIFKRVEHARTLATLKRLAVFSGARVTLQGFVWDIPGSGLANEKTPAELAAQTDAGVALEEDYAAQVGG